MTSGIGVNSGASKSPCRSRKSRISRYKLQLRMSRVNAMRIYIILIFLIPFLACGDPYQYINPREHESITLPSRGGVFKAAVKIQAESKCPSNILLFINRERWPVSVVSSIDTVLTMDWYGEELTFRAQIDSCLVGDPVIGVKFL